MIQVSDDTQSSTVGAAWASATGFTGSTKKACLSIIIINTHATATVQRRYGATGGAIEIKAGKAFEEPIPPGAFQTIDTTNMLQLYSDTADTVVKVVAKTWQRIT